MSSDVASVRTSYRVHVGLGTWLALPLAIVLLTGTLATLSPELDALLVPALSCPEAQADELGISFGALERAAREAMPEARIHGLSAPTEDGQCAFVLLEYPERTYHHVYVDPSDGHVTGTGSARTPRRFLRDLHRSLLLGENVGLFVIGLFSWVLLGALVTGLRTLGPLRRAVGAGRGSRRWHRRLALALLPFVALVVLTTGWYFVEHVLGMAEIRVTEVPPRRDAAIAARLTAGEATLDADALIARASVAYPELRPHFVALAVPRRTYVTVTGETDVRYVRDLSSQVFLDPFDGHVLRVQRADALSPLGRWEHGVDFLHFGTFAGSASRYLYTLLGLAMLGLVAAGAVGRWWRRRAQRRTPS